MAYAPYFELVQTVITSTSNPQTINSYQDTGAEKTLINEITTGISQNGKSQSIIKQSAEDTENGFLVITNDSFDSTYYPTFDLDQEVAVEYFDYFDLEQEVAVVYAPYFDLFQEIASEYAPYFNLQQTVIQGYAVYFNLRQIVGTLHAPSFDLQQQVQQVIYAPSFDLQQEIITAYAPSFDLFQQVLTANWSATNAIGWTAKVTLDGTDISALCLNRIQVSMEEGTPRQATVQYRPLPGLIDYCSLKNKVVTVDYINTGTTYRVFTGKVSRFDYDPTDVIVTLDCDDRLQDDVDAMERAVLDDLIGGVWSADVFDEDVDNWEYAEDLLSTVPKSLDKNAAGGLRITDWAAKGTADVVLGESEIQYRSPDIEIADSATIVNYVEVQIDNRYDRKWHRDVNISWRYPRSMCDYVEVPTELPNTEMVLGALDSGGWGIKRLDTVPLMDSGTFYCRAGGVVPVNGYSVGTYSPTGTFLWNNPHYPDLLVGFNATVFSEWDQNITERGEFVVKSPQSIATCGENKQTLTVSVDIESDEDSDEEDTNSPTTVNNRFSYNGAGCNLAASGGIFTAPGEQQPQGGYGVSRFGTSDIGAPPDGSSLLSNGDYALDAADQARYDLAAKVGVAQARRLILESHRQNFVSFTRTFLPVDVDMTLEVNVTNLHARGKVSSVIHALDITSGAAVTDVTVSVSKSNDDAVTEQVWTGSDWVVPPRPDNTAYLADVEQHNKTVVLPTQLGNESGGRSRAYCEELLGFSGNYHYRSLSVGANPKDIITSDVYKAENGDVEIVPPERRPTATTRQNTIFGNVVADTAVHGEPWPHRLTVEVDDVQEGLTDAVEIETSGEYTTQIPNELLDIN